MQFLTLHRLVQRSYQAGDTSRLEQIMNQLIDNFTGNSTALHIRIRGFRELAVAGIALGVDVGPYMDYFLDSLVTCFRDEERLVRLSAVDCLYNIVKVSQGEILVYFNLVFDALSQVRRI